MGVSAHDQKILDAGRDREMRGALLLLENELERTRNLAQLAHDVNLARLRELATYAQQKADATGNQFDRAYWNGVHFGLLRSISVLEGRG